MIVWRRFAENSYTFQYYVQQHLFEIKTQQQVFKICNDRMVNHFRLKTYFSR